MRNNEISISIALFVILFLNSCSDYSLSSNKDFENGCSFIGREMTSHFPKDGINNRFSLSIDTVASYNTVSASINATMQNTNTAQGATYFYSPYIKAPSWTNVLQPVTVPNSGKTFNFYKFK